MRIHSVISVFGLALTCAWPQLAMSQVTSESDILQNRPIRDPRRPGRPGPVLPDPREPREPIDPVRPPDRRPPRDELIPIRVDPRLVEIRRKGAPVPFRAFPLKDPSTGNGEEANAQPISPETVLTLPDGKQVNAAQYFQQLNQFEQDINRYGYSLRTPGDEAVAFSRTKIDFADHQRQRQRTIRGHDPRRVQVRRPIDEVRNEYSRDLGNVSRIRDAVGNVIREIGPIRPPRDFVASKNWSQSWGWSDKFAAFIDANVNLSGTADATTSKAMGSAGGYMFGQKLNIVRGETNYSAPRTGNLKGETAFYFLGVKLFSKTHNSPNPLFFANNWSQGLDKSTTIYFTIGPIPMSAKLGAQGSAGLDFRMDLMPLRSNSDIKPTVRSKVYIQVGTNVVVGGAGGGSDLILINDDLALTGKMLVMVDANGPYFLGNIQSNNNLLTLKGRVYAYVWVMVPRWGIPPWKKKQWDWNIFQLAGITANGSLFTYQNKVYL